MNERLFLTTLLNSLHIVYVKADTTELSLSRNDNAFKTWMTNPFTLLSQITDGKVLIETEEHSFELHSGHALILPAHVHHKITVLEEGTVSKWLNINFTLFEHFQLFDFIQAPYLTSITVGQQLAELHGKITTLMNVDHIMPNQSLYHLARVKGLLFQLIELILSCSTYTISGFEDINKYQRFHPVFSYIENHLQQKIMVAHLSTLMHLSKSHFYKEFKESFHMSPLQYIQSQRLKKAQYLLATTHLTMEKIGQQIGYQDAFQFIRFFKSIYGCSPSQYRKMMNEGD